jgi:hypothetical protein
MDIVQEICQEGTGNAVTDGSVVTASEDDDREGAKEAAGEKVGDIVGQATSRLASNFKPKGNVS